MVSETEPRFSRDASERLTHDRADIESSSYAEVCRAIAVHFGLQPASELLIGPDEMFWDFTNGTVVVELSWNNWFSFMITAKGPDAEPLVREMATFLWKIRPPR